MTNGTKTLLGFLAGIAVGAGAYAFLKSRRGQALKENLKEKANGLKDELSTLLEKGKAKLQEWENEHQQTSTSNS